MPPQSNEERILARDFDDLLQAREKTNLPEE
jgi:hypothetical protein